MCLADDADGCDFYQERMQRARKHYICGECFRPICKGEIYQYVFGVWEGMPNKQRTCEHCVVAQTWLRKECGSWLFGGVQEDIEDHLYGKSMTPYRLVVGMRRQWRKFKSKEFMKVTRIEGEGNDRGKGHTSEYQANVAKLRKINSEHSSEEKEQEAAR